MTGQEPGFDEVLTQTPGGSCESGRLKGKGLPRLHRELRAAAVSHREAVGALWTDVRGTLEAFRREIEQYWGHLYKLAWFKESCCHLKLWTLSVIGK